MKPAQTGWCSGVSGSGSVLACHISLACFLDATCCLNADCAKFSPRSAGDDAKSVMNGVVGPVALQVLKVACGCAATECSGHGKCRELNASVADLASGLALTKGGCICDRGYSGASCNIRTIQPGEGR